MLKYRPSDALDKNRITEWIAADPDHVGSDPDFWLERDQDRVDSWTVEDEQGTIFYVRAEKLLRLHIQFAPKSEHRRLAAAIDEFTDTIKQKSQRDFKQLIFESVFPPLIRFLQRRGFRSSPNEQVCDL